MSYLLGVDAVVALGDHDWELARGDDGDKMCGTRVDVDDGVEGDA